MKHLLLKTIAAVVLVGCGESQQSAPAPEVKPAEPVAEAATPEPSTAKAPDISLIQAAAEGNIEAVKQHLADGTDAKSEDGQTSLHFATIGGHKEIAELLIAASADMNAQDEKGNTPLHFAVVFVHKEIVELLIARGANVNAKNDKGWTPLRFGANINDSDEVVDLLKQHGAKYDY